MPVPPRGVLHLVIGAVVVGPGTPAFAAPPPAGLRLAGVPPLHSSLNLLARYEVLAA